MNDTRPRLVFVSPVFLFPTDAGGKIRTTNILRGLKGGAFHIRLLAPVEPAVSAHWESEINSVCDEFVAWRPTAHKPQWLRGLDLFGETPVNVAADATAAGLAAVQEQADSPNVDLIVFDFVHSSVLIPPRLRARSVCFTHNVEAEIFARHAAQTKDLARRWIWTSQHAKMVRFEGAALRRYDGVVAVSERDARHFREAYGVASVRAIPTGVDLDHFVWQPPGPVSSAEPPTVVFTGSMDSAANIDGVKFFLNLVWPRVLHAVPRARFLVVGRHPPAALQALGRATPNVEFTGFVEDVRPYIRRAQVSVIPLLVGGGTRIKAFEAMAMGSPVVSTTLGVEGLEVQPDVHFIQRDEAAAFADAVAGLLCDAEARQALSKRARELVESRFGHLVAARVFEDICLSTLDARLSAA